MNECIKKCSLLLQLFNLQIRRSSCHKPQYGWTLRVLCKAKLASCRRTNTAWLPLYVESKIAELTETQSRTVVARVWGGENRELLFDGYKILVMQDEYVPEICCVTCVWLSMLSCAPTICKRIELILCTCHNFKK